MMWEAMPESWNFRVSSGQKTPGEEKHYSWDLRNPMEIFYWGQEYRFPEGFSVRALVFRLDDATQVDLHVEGAAYVPCARCLRLVSLAINENFVYFYKLRPEGDQSEEEDDTDQERFVILRETTDVIDIREQVWETLLESLPAKALCDEGCLGICPRCGADLNERSCACVRDMDPRLAALFPLQEKNETEGGEH
jgi:uncharacterized protein